MQNGNGSDQTQAAEEDRGVEIPIEHQTEQQESDTANQEDKDTVSSKKLKERLAKAEAERDEYREHVMRKVAELENFRRRAEIEKEEFLRFANHDLMNKVLPVVDDLRRAVEASKESNDVASLQKGVEMVYNKAVQLFQDLGVQPMEVVGQSFDVNRHEALMTMPSEHPEGVIVQEIERGYTFRERVLRYAKVITSAGQAGEQPPAETAPAEDKDKESGATLDARV